MASYRIKLSEDFYSIVITVKKGDHEIESTLINYDLKGNIIDHQIIAYDEIAEGMFRTQSKILYGKLIVNQIAWRQEPQIEQITYQIFDNGIIDDLDSRVLNDELSNIPIITIALDKLKLNMLNVKTELIVSKEHPDNPDDIIMVIPEIVEEDDHYFELNSHIIIINGRSGQVRQKFFESSKTNGWASDAIMLKEIKIDTAPYIVSENRRAFGVRVYRYGASRANPYKNETLSLFLTSDDTLEKVLHNYNVMQYNGEYNQDCDGQFTRSKSVLILTEHKTSGYFDIEVKNTITKIKTFIDENGDCDEKKDPSTTTTVIRFNGIEYKQK